MTDISAIALNTGGDHDALLAADYPGADKSVEAHVQEMVGTIGENMTVRRSKTLKRQRWCCSQLYAQSGRRRAAKSVFLWLCNQRAIKKKPMRWGVSLPCMWQHNPLAVNVDSLNPEDIERERAVLIAEAKESGKPDEIIEKMVEGRLRKFYEEVVPTYKYLSLTGKHAFPKFWKMPPEMLAHQ